ncbi:MAG: hypothetical protein J6I64_09575 [Lachnospiraceae bacterium]|nr:hypothetical protein [Lachnospiraceae bacterium]
MNNLTIWNVTKDVSSTITSIVNTYKTLKTVRKEDSIRLKERLKALEQVVKIQGMGVIARANIEEIRRTQAYIDQCNLSGGSLDYAMGYLEELNNILRQNMKEYLNAY